ncbi:dihydroxyacetone kinase subunit DhaK, partial [Lacticaseibacillus nasuensis]|uniref:dihydroxyacetone kinase subunit DhaK n=1 Tax=Lacticaseibacillus nasuensis TaxID=944671 RepID=UPI000A5A3054
DGLGPATRPVHQDDWLFAGRGRGARPRGTKLHAAAAFGGLCVGIHGEPGYRTEPFQSAELLARELITKLRQAFRWQAGEQYAVLVNSLGGTTVMENLVFNRDVRELLALQPITVASIMSATSCRPMACTGCR